MVLDQLNQQLEQYYQLTSGLSKLQELAVSGVIDFASPFIFLFGFMLVVYGAMVLLVVITRLIKKRGLLEKWGLSRFINKVPSKYLNMGLLLMLLGVSALITLFLFVNPIKNKIDEANLLREEIVKQKSDLIENVMTHYIENQPIDRYTSVDNFLVNVPLETNRFYKTAYVINGQLDKDIYVYVMSNPDAPSGVLIPFDATEYSAFLPSEDIRAKEKEHGRGLLENTVSFFKYYLEGKDGVLRLFFKDTSNVQYMEKGFLDDVDYIYNIHIKEKDSDKEILN